MGQSSIRDIAILNRLRNRDTRLNLRIALPTSPSWIMWNVPGREALAHTLILLDWPMQVWIDELLRASRDVSLRLDFILEFGNVSLLFFSLTGGWHRAWARMSPVLGKLNLLVTVHMLSEEPICFTCARVHKCWTRCADMGKVVAWKYLGSVSNALTTARSLDWLSQIKVAVAVLWVVVWTTWALSWLRVGFETTAYNFWAHQQVIRFAKER